MGLHLVGINHQSASLELREAVAFAPAHLPQLLSSLCDLPGVEEALLLSTCNRTEICYFGANSNAHSLDDWLVSNSRRADEVMRCLYRHSDDAAINHVCRVAIGLDSMILGEPQILGQLKTAYRVAQETDTLGPQLYRLLQHSFAVAKEVRSETQIGAAATSAASAAISLAQQVFGDFANKRALMIGAGEMIEIVGTHLNSRQIGGLMIANRSASRGNALAAKLNCRASTLEALPKHLAKADLIFSSTASPQAIVTRAMLSDALAVRRHRPMFVVDLAVPRDIESDCAELSDVFLYTVDDLHRAVDDNLESRREAAAAADKIITAHTSRYLRNSEGLRAAPLIRAMRRKNLAHKNEILSQAQRQLAAGKSSDDVLQWLADALTNRFLHAPSVAMRSVAEVNSNQSDSQAQNLLNLAQQLFDLEPDELD